MEEDLTNKVEKEVGTAEEASENEDAESVITTTTEDGDETPEKIVPAQDLPLDSKVAFSDLVTTVLQLDFDDEFSRDFRKNVVSLVVQQLQLPEKMGKSLRERLDAGWSSDIVPLICTLKSDTVLRLHGQIVLLADLVTAFIRTGIYDSRYRVVLHHVATLLGVRWEEVEAVEDKVAHLLIEETYVESQEAADVRKKQEKRKKIKRYLMIGATGTVGGVLIGLTGGLAAPLVAAGAGALVGTGVAAGIATTAGAAVLGSVFGVAGAGLAGYKMNKRVGAVEEFVVETLTDGQSLHCAIGVSGWVVEDREDAFRWAWRHLNASKEQYCLRYETEYLLQVGKAMDYFMSIAVGYAVQQTLMETAFATLVSAIAWPVALVSVASVIDNPWNVCVRRAQEVGQHLANILLTRQQGQRPVSLLGFSLGARVIYHCLLEMSKRPNCCGIVENVVFLGAPVTGSSKEWTRICKVVGGRVINGYSTTDWLLKFLYRTMSVQLSIAGISPVQTRQRKIINVNLTHIISGHMDYRHKLTEVLEAVGVRTTPHTVQSFQNLAVACESSKSSPSPTSQNADC